MGVNKEKIEKQKKERLGEMNYNYFGTLMKIIEYNGVRDIWVEFQDKHKYKVHTNYQAFLNKMVNNPYDKKVHNVGYFGVGKYNTKEHRQIWTTWNDMLRRCYDPYTINNNLVYKDCFVCKKWHNFQNFAEWYEENFYEIERQVMQLDKDILIKENKIYSPNTCIIVPQRINALFTKSDKIRGKYPIGVHKHTKNNSLIVQCSIFEGHKKKKINLGSFPLNKPFQAFNTYKTFKENYIKQIADEYKDLIPQKLYDALYKYEVEIND